MAKGLSFLSVKCLRDATGAVFFTATGSLTNSPVAVLIAGKSTEFDIISLPSGHRQLKVKITSNLTVLRYKVTLASGISVERSIGVPTQAQRLNTDFADLTQSFNEVKDRNSQTFSFSESLQYPEGKGQNQTVLYPSSTSEKLDTSTRSDFYYTADGSFAYIASNDLQNQFLNNLNYAPAGTTRDTVGRFEGGTQNTSLGIISSSVANANTGDIEGPVVFGEIVAIDLPAISATDSGTPTISVCTIPDSSNYYLRGCINESLPCTDNGIEHAQDCNSVPLTAAIINASEEVDGGCCVECDNLDLSITDINAADTDVANGTVTFTLDSPTLTTSDIGYTLVGTPTNPLLSFSDVNVDLSDQALPYTVTYSNLYPGSYSIKVGGGVCSYTDFFTIPDNETTVSSNYGCTDNTALNYDAAATNVDALCVFCDSVTGNFIAGGNNTWTHSFPNVLAPVELTSATSNPDGTSNTDGIIHFTGDSSEWELWNDVNYEIWNLGEEGFFQFNPATALTSDQALPFVHKLYKLDVDLDTFIQVYSGAAQGGASTLTVVTSNATLISTQTGNGSQAHTFTGLATGDYVVVTQYDNDGTLDGDDEIEQCYNIEIVGNVQISGCTDSTALNYNSAATIGDGSCNYDAPEECGKIDLRIELECGEDYYGNRQVQFKGVNPLLTDSNLSELISNQQFTYTQGPLIGQSYPQVVNPNLLNNPSLNENLVEEYIYAEILCHDQTNNTQLHLDNWQFNDGFGPGYALGPLDVNYMYQPQVTQFNFFYGDGYILNDTNGNPPSSPIGNTLYTHFIVNIKINYSDGTSEIIEQPLGRWFGGVEGFINTDNNVVHYIIACEGFQAGLVPVSYSYSYNWGSFDNPEYVYESDTLFFEGGVFNIDGGGTTCCDIDNPVTVFECTDPTATNYCCPEGTEGVVTDNSLCTYEEVQDILGCTDPTSSNFNPLATINDGTCADPATALGSWFCQNAAAGECQFILGNLNGFETQQECEESCEDSDPDDCLELNNWVNANSVSMSATSTNAATTYNDTTGLCDVTSNGTVTINIPDSSSLNINNPNGVVFQVILWQNGGSTFANYYEGGATSFNNQPVIGAGDYLSLATYSGSTYTFTNVPEGCWNYALKFWSDAISETEGLVPTNQSSYCEGYNNNVCVSTSDCNNDSGDPIVHGCTDPNAENYDSSAEINDGTCTYPCNPCEGDCLCPDGTYSPNCCPIDPENGCTDPAANNFNSNATLDDGSCQYDIVGCSGDDCDGSSEILPGCTPQNINSLLEYNNKCIASSGNRFYTKLVTGLGDDCSTMEAWKMIIIQEILNRKGLPCIYNCTDSSTPAIGAATSNCTQKWEDGGSIYWNPADASAFSLGTVVKRATDGLDGSIYVAISNSGLTIDPSSTDSTSITSGWKKCVNINAPTDNSDYLEKFVSFAKSYCRDCGIPPYTQETEVNVQVTTNFTVGGSSITNDGVSFGPSNN
jgi:hypothetical protein